MTDTDLTWTPPDGGTWWFEAAHFPHPVSRLFAHVIDVACGGWFDGAKRFGAPRRRSRWAHVNGYLFYGEPDEPGGVYEGDPALAARAVEERWWVSECERWFGEEKPAVTAINQRLQRVDVAALDDRELAHHVLEALDHLLASAPIHFAHRGRELSRQTLRAKAAEEGIDLDLSAVFAGGSPASSRPSQLVRQIAAALRDGGHDPSNVRRLDDIRAVPAAAALLDAYLDEFGHRLLDSYDLACPTLIERPEVVVASVRAAGTGEARSPERVDLPPMSPELAQLLEEARISAGTEDDDDGVCIFWPSGLLRRAMLELARRRGLEDPAAVFELDPDELRAYLDGGGPPNDELLARLRARLAAAAVRPPQQLGGDATVPDPDATPAESLSGVGVGTGTVRGRACVVRGVDSDGLYDIEPGDVLVAVTTTPGYNAVMPIVAAIATETNMGHTIIAAREHGIPAVVAVPGLTDAVPHGALVEVDASAGVVRVITSSAGGAVPTSS